MTHLELTRVAPIRLFSGTLKMKSLRSTSDRLASMSTVPVKRKMTATSSVVMIIKSKCLSMTTTMMMCCLKRIKPGCLNRLDSRSSTSIFKSLTLVQQYVSFPFTLSTPWWFQLRHLCSSCLQ